MTEEIFRADAYKKSCAAQVLQINARDGIVLNRTVFYPNGGGTHVARTGEIGPVTITKIEKKGARNRRVRVAFA